MKDFENDKLSISSLIKLGANENNNNAKWTNIFPQILQSKRLHCINQTAESAQLLHDTYGFFANGKELSHEVEHLLFEAFIEDYYDGMLHLTTIHNVNLGVIVDEESSMGRHNISGIGAPIGLVFWRKIPDEEMTEWLNFNHLQKYLSEQQQSLCIDMTQLELDDKAKIHNNDVNRLENGLKLVRQRSIHSMKLIPSAASIAKELIKDKKDANNGYNNLKEQLSHAWIKIELLAVREQYWGQRLGSLLLASALYNAHLHTQTRAILHVAGGEENVPAVRLYRRFGFLPVARDTLYNKPDRDLYVLGDIGNSLDALAWNATLGVTEKEK